MLIEKPSGIIPRDDENQPEKHSFGNLLAQEQKMRERLAMSKDHPEGKNAWETFLSTGAIGDYLRYRENLPKEDAGKQSHF